MTTNGTLHIFRERVIDRLADVDAVLNDFDAAIQSGYNARAYEILQTRLLWAVEGLDDATYSLVHPPFVMKLK